MKIIAHLHRSNDQIVATRHNRDGTVDLHCMFTSPDTDRVVSVIVTPAGEIMVAVSSDELLENSDRIPMFLIGGLGSHHADVIFEQPVPISTRPNLSLVEED